MPLDLLPADAPPPPRVPGPPLLGNTLQIAGDPATFFARTYERYGPISEVSMLGRDYVVLGGMEAFDFFIRERERYFSRGAFYARFAQELGTGMFILGEPAGRHRHLRGQMRLGFSRQVAAEFLPDLIEAVDDGIDRAGTGRVTAMDWVGRVAFDQYSRIMCGRSLDSHYADAAFYAQRIMNVGAKIWPAASLHTPRYKKARAAVFDLMHGLVDGYDPAGGDGRLTILDALMAAETDDGAPLDRENKIAAALYGFVGTVVYMNRAISFLLYDLLSDPALLAKVRAEADAVFTKEAPDSLSLRGMTVLRAALKESMRIHPIALALPFVVEEDFVFHGHRVAKGKYCVITGVPGHFARGFYTDPYAFDAIRCLPPRNEHKRRGAHVPFGFGARVCPAVGLVDTIVLTTVARLLHRCDVAVDPVGHKLETRLNPLPGPSKAFGLKLSPRSTAAAGSADGAVAPGGLAANALEELFGGNRLNDPGLQSVLERTAARSYPANRLLIREGDVADTFFILVDGTVDVTAGPEERPLARLEPGAFFGELGLLGGGRRTANCRTATPVMVLEMDREAFLTIVRDADLVPGEIAATLRHRYLKERVSAAIPQIDGGALSALVDGASVRDVPAGTDIVRQGEDAEEFFILLSGTARVVRTVDGGGAAEEELGVLGPGDFFGEIGILESRPRTATVRAGSDGPVGLLAVPRAQLLDLVRTSPEARADIGAVLVDRMVRSLPTAE